MIIDGKKIAAEILNQLQADLKTLAFRPKLIDVVVGDDPVIASYVKIKGKRAAEVGIDFEAMHLPTDIKQEELETKVRSLNGEKSLCGLIIQLPLPKNIDKQKVLDQINSKLDVDVITSTNLGRLFTGEQTFVPATAAAIMKMLDYHQVQLEGKNTLVVGAGDLVGKPVSFLLMQRHATVTIANEHTMNLKDLCLNADVIICGTGVPKLIKADMVKPGAVIIDAGTAESAGGISGDVDFESVQQKATLVSPVPGGVGPMTVAMLLSNVVQSAKLIDKQ